MACAGLRFFTMVRTARSSVFLHAASMAQAALTSFGFTVTTNGNTAAPVVGTRTAS